MIYSQQNHTWRWAATTVVPLALLTLLFPVSFKTHARIFGNVAPAPCAPGGVNVDSGNGLYCISTGVGDSTGVIVFGSGQKFLPLGSNVMYPGYIGEWDVYAPYSGVYRAGLGLCSGASRCTLANSDITLISINSFTLTSHTRIRNQTVEAGGFPATTLSTPHSACTFLVDSSGRRWSSTDPTSCQDGGSLPETPAVCYLNANADLNVALGTLERGSITTTPAAGSPGNMKKDVPVLCTRDAGTTVSTTFQYTPVTFNGHEVISTTSNGLGVAVFYKGQLVGPSSAPITETFALGETRREFEFQAVRDPAVALKDIPTGNFTASATMVMTQQ